MAFFDRIYGAPGEENLDELVLTRHEQGAILMAAAHSRPTSRPHARPCRQRRDGERLDRHDHLEIHGGQNDDES
ncbi:hypothetical protein CN128_33935 [Sinorhizobium meliloti]|nr:hypothetical protein SMRU11_31190 [Sinorhizobium meliloti RU11/001]MQW84990.1 hypothetical protein [Sinorhizobium meliloti]PST24885.1 hypothetical protein C7U62_17315 [Mesorhizobium loti]RVG58322.1 hypothetical protein CN222_30920 [Sinorhizobium meliloti]RVH65892.1 hypothetical protein CN203_36600 [Sinorhizobium meliloti]